jgi:hypothetical protein
MESSRPQNDSPPLQSSTRLSSGTYAKVPPPFDLISRQDSTDSNLSPVFNDVPRTPTSFNSEDIFSSPEVRSNGSLTPSSYVYSKYSLGKLKQAKRESVGIEEFINRQFSSTWDDPTREPETHFALPILPLPSPSLAASPTQKNSRPADINTTNGFVFPGPLSSESKRGIGKLRKSRPNTPNVTQASETSTLKGPRFPFDNKPASIYEMSADDHLQKGIELHESGDLQKSTYHLRLSAKAGHPTAMVLYALACRHGWGMKPAPAEGVSWLQKAVDLAQTEVQEDDTLASRGVKIPLGERNEHKAQLALGVYELGVSYAKGWGVAQDKALALKCWEIAAQWGDVDAAVEAGLAYQEGMGTKKDLKRSASFYRIAEEKGVRLAGNSW